MAKASTTFRLTFDGVIDPDTGQKTLTVHVTETRATHIEQRGDLAVVEMYVFVGEAVCNPRAVYRGVRQHGEDWDGRLCYVGVPERRFIGKMLPIMPAEDGDLFMVFVNPDGTAYHWRWERPDPKNSGLPVDADRRFGKRVL